MDTYFSTKDFNTLVLLRYHGYKFEQVTYEGATGKTKRVHVNDTPELRQLLLNYDNNDVMVKMRDLMRTIEDVKEFVHR